MIQKSLRNICATLFSFTLCGYIQVEFNNHSNSVSMSHFSITLDTTRASRMTSWQLNRVSDTYWIDPLVYWCPRIQSYPPSAHTYNPFVKLALSSPRCFQSPSRLPSDLSCLEKSRPRVPLGGTEVEGLRPGSRCSAGLQAYIIRLSPTKHDI